MSGWHVWRHAAASLVTGAGARRRTAGTVTEYGGMRDGM